MNALRYIHRVWVGFHVLKIIGENSGINKTEGFFSFLFWATWRKLKFFIHRHRNKVVSQYWCKYSAVVYLLPFQNRGYKQSKCEFLNLPFESKTVISAMTFTDIPIIPIMSDSPLKEAFACCKGNIFVEEAGEQQMQHGRSDGNRTDTCVKLSSRYRWSILVFITWPVSFYQQSWIGMTEQYPATLPVNHGIADTSTTAILGVWE